MKILMSTLFIFFSSLLTADISKYFKEVENKSDINKMRNIDFIYLINLDKRPDRLQRSLNQLHPYGIFPCRFSAVNGYSFTLDEINEMGVTLAPGMKTGEMGIVYYQGPDGIPLSKHEIMNEFGKTYMNVTHGALGCILSHLSILQDAYDSKYETIWVMEDDIEVIRNPSIIPDLIDELDRVVGKDNWDVLFTDIARRDELGRYQDVRIPPIPCRPNFPCTDKKRFSLRGQVSKRFSQIGARWGTHSMIIRRSGMKKILGFIKTLGIFSPYDHDLYLTEGIRLFIFHKDIVSNLVITDSDISRSSWDLANSAR